ncbi:thiopurine S-methyltransferase [Elysia marginata]|uniref:Thiopurine S-methyltransferase n=1 Tax=Elysia marginata TaxID=1093978 RepID=A0AAV4IUG7_9GAST|nr:thiopurine S-methyltransferase [Elysia marginata]
MSTIPPYSPEDPFNYWNFRYDSGHTEWNLNHVHPVLERFFNKLNPDGKPKKVLVTMCGMSEDMNWLADKGMEVVGVEIALQALTKFVSQSGQDWTETAAPKLGPDAKMFTRKDGRIKLYWGDALKFSEDLEGKFDAIYDCDGLHVLDSSKTPEFAKMIKSVLNPGGIMLLEAIAYDKNILEDKNFQPPLPVPPPYSVAVEDVKRLFEPECSVEVIDKHTNNLLYGHESNFYSYIIVKK